MNTERRVILKKLTKTQTNCGDYGYRKLSQVEIKNALNKVNYVRPDTQCKQNRKLLSAHSKNTRY